MSLSAQLSLIPLPTAVEVDEGSTTLTTASRLVADPALGASFALPLTSHIGSTLERVEEGADAGDITVSRDETLPAEGYRLSVTDRIDIAAADAAGAFYAAHTLVQLLEKTADDTWVSPRVRINDAPRFAYRGVMLDVARHFFSVDDVKAYIDRTSALKYNHLHLHLTDDQGWRIEIDAWPLLTEKASSTSANGAPGGFYTKDDYREIVAYAAERHMVLVPEIDLPGHTHAVGVAYPELVEDPVMNDVLLQQAEQLQQELPIAGKPYIGWGVGHSSVRIHEERTYEFVTDVLRELAEITPGPYLHIGGDEALGTPAEDFAHFIARATAITQSIGKTPVAWHEAGASADIAEGTVGQYWGKVVPEGTHAADAAHFVARNGQLIMSACDAAYLDMKYSEDFSLGLSWAGYIPVQKAYEWEPTAVVPDVDDDAILGVEAPLWAETLSSLDDVDVLAFPRAAAIAEIAWSPAEGADRTWESFRTRVAGLAPLWQARGIGFHRAEGIDWPEA
ncbi:family 20 glycosylhydrolase [Microbacterium sp. YY-01]|uniref:family 20 glycosylhydrolase n=1 Tax=Microbacterium sp. YY-01 TaxID=3421634 RepID=UPI003D17ACE8